MVGFPRRPSLAPTRRTPPRPARRALAPSPDRRSATRPTSRERRAHERLDLPRELSRRIRAAARDRLRLRRLRPGQEDAIATLASGGDALVVMPTGAGKSAVYQVAGLLLDGPTVVVSPLIALQKDQVEALNSKDAGGAARINSTLSAAEREEAWRRLEAGEVEFLFLAPEQFNQPETLRRLKAARPSLFVVDEAHCISEWGHSFRPEYLRLGTVIEALGHPVTLALTATASPDVRDEITARLGLRSPMCCVRGFDRPNIWLGVSRHEVDHGKRRALLEAVKNAERPGIVYVSTQKRAEEVSKELVERGEKAVFYHGGLGGGARDLVQDAFMTDDDTEVIVATSAFGMGVDKPDVRFVFHHDVSDSLDAYYQEIGRGGRDGQPARALLFFRPEDLGLRRFFAGTGQVQAHEVEKVAAAVKAARRAVKPDRLRERTGLSEAKISAALTGLSDVGAIRVLAGGTVRAVPGVDMKEAAREAALRRERRKAHERARVEVMRAYAESTGCRRRFLLNYFGESYDQACGNCDNCAAGRGQLVTRRNRPFPARSFVRHAEWGRGVVVRYAPGRIVVFFDEVGEKALSLAVVLGRRLLEPVA